MRKNIAVILAVSVLISAAAPGWSVVHAASEEITIKEAIQKGLKNSLDIKILEKQKELSYYKLDKAKDIQSDLESGSTALKGADTKVSEASSQIAAAQAAIDEAQEYIDDGKAPADMDLSSLGLPITLKKGDDIAVVLKAVKLEAYADTVIKSIKADIEKKQKQLDEKKKLLSESQLTYSEGKMKYAFSMQLATGKISDSVSISELEKLSGKSAGEILVKMARESMDVTLCAEGIYRNQIALLLQKSYYDALKAKEMTEVKEAAMQRAKSQYDFALEGYNTGMKAKDDMLLANIYYTGTQLEWRKAQQEYDNCMTELKKNMNIPLDSKLKLKDVLAEENESRNFDEDLKNALQNRLEIKKARAELNIYGKLLDIVEEDYGDDTDRYEEAYLLYDKSSLCLDKTKLEVSSSVYQSYATMDTLWQMLTTGKQMVDMAKESVEIAKYKYKEGFGSESSLLKKNDLESVSGTELEVITAQENLAQVESKMVEILYGYNLAKAKYLNDIGVLLY